MFKKEYWIPVAIVFGIMIIVFASWATILAAQGKWNKPAPLPPTTPVLPAN